MKKMGAPIRFSESAQSYLYEEFGQFFIGFLNEIK
jgi:hypothetical protein